MNQFKTFEKDLKSLDDMVQKLESGELGLSDALKTFEEGMTLFNRCHETLSSVESRVKILINDVENGEKIAVDFDELGE